MTRILFEAQAIKAGNIEGVMQPQGQACVLKTANAKIIGRISAILDYGQVVVFPADVEMENKTKPWQTPIFRIEAAFLTSEDGESVEEFAEC